MTLRLRTQVGGKYSPDDDSVFRVKRILQAAGVLVRHPMADRVVGQIGEVYCAYDTRRFTFLEIEADYYTCLADCHFHVVSNLASNVKGYVGESAAIEIGYALLQQRPIWLLHKPIFGARVDADLREIVAGRERQMLVRDLLGMDTSAVRRQASELQGYAPDYRLSVAEAKAIYARVRGLFLNLVTPE